MREQGKARGNASPQGPSPEKFSSAQVRSREPVEVLRKKSLHLLHNVHDAHMEGAVFFIQKELPGIAGGSSYAPVRLSCQLRPKHLVFA